MGKVGDTANEKELRGILRKTLQVIVNSIFAF